MGVSSRCLRDRDLPGGQYYRFLLAPSIYLLTLKLLVDNNSVATDSALITGLIDLYALPMTPLIRQWPRYPGYMI